MAARSRRRTRRFRRQADRRRLSPGWPAAGQHADVELEGDRRDQRARARSGRAIARRSGSGRCGRQRPTRSGAALYPPLPARRARRRARRDARQAAGLRQGAGDAGMTRPRVGFLGTGWIGRHRMEAMIATGVIEPFALSDPSTECAAKAAKLAPGAAILPTLEAMLDHGLDGLVIATPSALHAEQAIAALDRGIAVFCQKPLGRNAPEAAAVVEAARRADRLLGLDLSYRHTAAARAMASVLKRGDLGEIFAVDL